MADTQAQYRQRDDGQLDVIDRCRQANGDMTDVVGCARQNGFADSPRLEVRFAPAWLSGLRMVRGHYWVIDLDPGYQLVAVSEPNCEYLWILSRTPMHGGWGGSGLVGPVAEKGFDLGRLELTAKICCTGA